MTPVDISLIGIIILTSGLFWRREQKMKDEEYQFITIVAHKLRTPLTGLSWGIDELKGTLSSEEKALILRELSHNTKSLLEIVDLLKGFVTYNKKLNYTLEASSIPQMIEESVVKYEQLARKKNIAFRVDSDGAIPLLIFNKRKIQFVIDMLVDNAVKYTPVNGLISIISKVEHGSIVVSVKDSGIGLTATEIKNLFAKFFRTDRARNVDTNGMGMGLYTARKIMRHSGGTLTAESEGKDRGTTFFMNLPMRRRIVR